MLRHLTISLLFITAVTFTHADEPDFKRIFNGKDFTGWELPDKNRWWKAEDGVLSVKSGLLKKGNNIWTEKKYKNFIIECDFKMGEGIIDSGIFIRTERQQIQIGISGSLKRDMTCSPYIPGDGYPVEAEGIKELLKEKDWNHTRIRADGKQYTIWLNGKQVLDWESPKAIEEGKIGLQLHGGKVMAIDFKNLQVAELP